MPEFTVQATVMGRRGAWLTPLRLETDGPLETVQDLLTAIVREQVAAFEQRQAESQYLTVLTAGRWEAGRESGEWAASQQECLRAERVQPFKQAFRELYLLTAAERETGSYSGRYEGQQVNPGQAVALLGKRGG